MPGIKVSKHWKNGKHVGWRKYLGGRNFHLVYGTDRASEEASKRVRKALLARWRLKQLEGTAEWTQAEIDECHAIGQPQPDDAADAVLAPATPQPAITPIQPAEAPSISDGKTTHAVLDDYVAFQGERLAGGMISVGHHSSLCDRIVKLKEGLTDEPLALVGVAKIGKAVRHFTAQPVSEKTGRPLSFVTVKELIKTLRGSFDWCDREGHWIPVRRWVTGYRRLTRR